ADCTAIPGLLGCCPRFACAAARALVIASVRPGERNGMRFMPPATLTYAGLSVPAAIRCGTLGAALEPVGWRVTATVVATAARTMIQIRRFTFFPLPVDSERRELR